MAQQQRLTSAQWEEIEAELKLLYNPVYLDCDGYLVRLALERAGAMKLAIVVYVNGEIRSRWLRAKIDSEEGRRFFRLCSEFLFSAKDRRPFEKRFGKREAERRGFYKRHYWREPAWSSTGALRRHLTKHNEVIRRVDPEEAEARLAEIRKRRSSSEVAA